MVKKQIVFVEPKPISSTLKIARALKLKGGYETVLVTFTKVDEELIKFTKRAFDKIFVLEIDLTLSPRKFFGLFDLFKKLFDRKICAELRKIKELKPYIVQIKGPSLTTFLSLLLIRKYPKIYYLQDIKKYYYKKITLSLLRGKERSQVISTLISDLSCKNCDGILNRSGENSLQYMKDKIKIPILDFLPYCLDEWIIPIKKKALNKNKNIHMVFAGSARNTFKGHASFLDVINKIIAQKIHLHLYPMISEKDLKNILEGIVKNNHYFHLYPTQNVDKINETISKYDYALDPDFPDNSMNSLWLEASMSAKIFSNMEAGLPTIIDKQYKNMVNILESNKMGIVITYNDLNRLKKILEDYKYPSLNEIKKAQDNLKISKKIHLLEEFYDKIANQFKK